MKSPPAPRADWVWEDPAPLQRRTRKGAVALATVARELGSRQSRSPAQAEFLRLQEEFGALADDRFEPLRQDPQTYFWARIAYELLRGETEGRLPPLARGYCLDLEAQGPRQALERHLADFGRFAAGAALLAGSDCRFATPVSVQLPAALPGTPLQLSGSGSARLGGVRGGTPWVEADRGLVEECPMAARGSVAVRLQPAIFHLPGLDVGNGAAAADLAFQRRCAPLVTRAFELVERFHPETWRQFGRLIRVVAMKPREKGSLRNNLSHSDLPGAMVVSLVENPHFLGDVLIHEFHHNRLFCLEEEEPLLEDEAGQDLVRAPRYATAHQVVPRPLHGIVHALYVFVPVTRYWLRVSADPDVDDAVRELARDRTLRGALCARICAYQVRSYAKLSRLGGALLARLEDDLEELWTDVRAAGLSGDTPALECREDGSLHHCRNPGSGPALTVREWVRARLLAIPDAPSAPPIADQVRRLLEVVR